MQATKEMSLNIINFHNELTDAYEVIQKSLTLATDNLVRKRYHFEILIKYSLFLTKKRLEQVPRVQSHGAKVPLDDEMAKCEREKLRLMALIEKLSSEENQSNKEAEHLSTLVEKLETESRACSRAKNVTRIRTAELHSSQDDLTQPQERLMDIEVSHV